MISFQVTIEVTRIHSAKLEDYFTDLLDSMLKYFDVNTRTMEIPKCVHCLEDYNLKVYNEHFCQYVFINMCEIIDITAFFVGHFWCDLVTVLPLTYPGTFCLSIVNVH